MILFTRNFDRLTFQSVLILLFMAVAIAPAAYADDLVDGARAAPEPLRAARPTFEIGPIDGLTTDWHPAPAWTSIPAGTILMLHQAAQLDEMVVWSGAYEFARDESGSTAIAILHAVGPQQISVEVAPYLEGAGASFSSSSTFDVVNIRFDYISVSPIVVDLDPPTSDPGPDVVEPTGFEDLTDNQSQFGGAGGSGSSGGDQSLVLLEVDVNPPGFAPLMEWRLDDQPALLGPAVLMRSADIELSMVEVGPVSTPSTLQGSSETASANAPSVFASNRIASPHGGSSLSPQPASRDDDKRSRRESPNDPAEAGDGGDDDDLWAPEDGTDIYNTNSGNVGIGTQTPHRKLDVVGTASIRGDVGIGTLNPSTRLAVRAQEPTHQIFSVNRPASNTAALYVGNDSDQNAVIASNNADLRLGRDLAGDFTEHMVIQNDGNVGIGTTTPEHALDVVGAIRADSLIVEGDAGVEVEGEIIAQGQVSAIAFASTNSPLADGEADFPLITGTIERARIDGKTGHMGIGTVAPRQRLDVSDPDSGVGIRVGSTAFDLPEQGFVNLFEGNDGARLVVNGEADLFQIKTRSAQTDFDVITIPYIGLNAGRVGIQTTTPAFTLDVNGDIGAAVMNADELNVDAVNVNMLNVNTVTASGAMNADTLSVGGGTTLGNGLNVTSGATTLGSVLNVSGATTLKDLTVTPGFNGMIVTNSNGFELTFEGGDAGDAANIRTLNGELALLAAGGLHLGSGGVNDRVFIDPSGAVGIGTTSPNALLDVNGVASVKVLRITGADLAEKFPVSERVEPGMVVAIDPDRPGQLCLARGAYNRCVAGVVSGANNLSVGAVLGNLPGQEDAPPIALSGRVWVYCDATDTAIKPGDLLTTSSTPGHAMKVLDYQKGQGAIIGKAMTCLDQGTGFVLVLVSLQ